MTQLLFLFVVLSVITVERATSNEADKRRLGSGKPVAAAINAASSVSGSKPLLRGSFGKREATEEDDEQNDDEIEELLKLAEKRRIGSAIRGKNVAHKISTESQDGKSGPKPLLRGSFGKRASLINDDDDFNGEFDDDDNFEEWKRAGLRSRYGKRGQLRGRYGKRAGSLRGIYG